MIQLILGFIGGVWFGTRYDCKVYIDMVDKWISDKFPKER